MTEQIKTRFSTKYGLDTPIAQAGMAFGSMTAGLPAAVSEAGAIGCIANVGMFPPMLLESIWAEARELTNKPLTVNLISCFVEPAIIETCAKLGVTAVSFHWGRPDPAWVKTLHDSGVDVWEQVGSVEEAARAAADGIDVIIAQGSEAGGHNYGESSLLTLVPAVRRVIGDLPLLAAGGIVDGDGMAASLNLGADGVWVGTRFLATDESDAHPQWRQKLVEATGAQTVRTHVFGRASAHFNPMRVLRNRVVDEWHDKVDQIPVDNSDQPVIGQMNVFGQDQPLHRFQNFAPMTSATGDFEELPLLCGEGVGSITDIIPAADVVSRMSSQAISALNKGLNRS